MKDWKEVKRKEAMGKGGGRERGIERWDGGEKKRRKERKEKVEE